VIFKETTSLCSEICRILVKYAASTLAATRQHATALLYLMLRKNWEMTKRIAKVRRGRWRLSREPS